MSNPYLTRYNGTLKHAWTNNIKAKNLTQRQPYTKVTKMEHTISPLNKSHIQNNKED